MPRPGPPEASPIPRALTAAIETAYDLFPWGGPRPQLILCHCNVCVGEDDARALARTEPRQLPARLVAEYTNSAHEWNEVSEGEFKELLPRYFDLLARFEAPAQGGYYHYALNRLRDADYRTRWPSREAAVVDAFFDAYIPYAARALAPETKACAACGRRHWRANPFADIIAMIVIAGFGADRIIEILRHDRSEAVTLQLADLILKEVTPVGTRHSFHEIILSDPWQEAQAIGDWLMSPEVGTRLRDAFFGAADPDRQALLSEAEQRNAWARRAT